jgi:hypothetical protein
LKHRRLALLCAMLVLAAVVASTPLIHPTHARAHIVLGPIEVGTSFSPARAESLGLDYQVAFQQLETMHFKVIRLSAYWDQTELDGYAQLDWMLAAAAQAHQPIVLSVGMKGLGWPEFYIPPAAAPAGIADGADVAKDPQLRMATLDFVKTTVERYRESPVLTTWQVENEPLNRAGPHRWWIGRDFLAAEVALVRSLDSRPLIVNAFGHFNMGMDAASNRNGFDLRKLLGFDADSAERQSLSVLGPGDILGLDAYTEIGYRGFLGQPAVSHASSDWASHLGTWRRHAMAERKHAWVTEMQAEPWEASTADYLAAKSTGPADLKRRFEAIHEQGYPVVLLWGSEYWLARQAAGDPSWTEAAQKLASAGN